MNKSLNLLQLSFVLLLTAILADVAPAQSDKKTDKKSMKTMKAEKAEADPFEQISFNSKDGLEITADLYWQHDDKTKPFIVLCHQAGWSRGEYREIAPALNELGFNCMAIDQRSGGKVNGIDNESTARATKANKPVDYVDAEQDIIAAVEYARENYAAGKLILWGSSYSAALTLRVTGEHSDKIDGALAFAPGEYFTRSGKPGNWIATSAKKISCPVFITSAQNEKKNWAKIYAAIESESKTSFLPKTKGNHGSRALWAQFKDSKDYWSPVKTFLENFTG